MRSVLLAVLVMLCGCAGARMPVCGPSNVPGEWCRGPGATVVESDKPAVPELDELDE